MSSSAAYEKDYNSLIYFIERKWISVSQISQFKKTPEFRRISFARQINEISIPSILLNALIVYSNNKLNNIIKRSQERPA